VYNSETKMVEESIHIKFDDKFDDKESNNKLFEPVESFAEF